MQANGNGVVEQEAARMNIKGMDAELYEAAIRGSYEVMSRIANWREEQTPTKNNVLHLHVGKPLVKKAKNLKRWDPKVDTVFVQKVVEEYEGYMLLWKGNNDGDTPLHLAAGYGRKNAVVAFLRRANQVNQDEVTRLLKLTNRKKDMALHEAARAGHADVVKLLVQAAPSCPHHEPNEEGETPLYLAAERGCTSSVLYILETCSPSVLAYNCKGPCGRTALHAAVQWGDSEMVIKLLAKDGSLISIRNEEGLTPLHCAAVETNKLELLHILVRDKANNNESSAAYIQDNIGRTALHMAVLQLNWKAMRYLIEAYPDIVDIVDNKEQNVVHYGAKWTCIGVMKGLLSAGYLDKLVNKKDVDGNTPFHILAASIPQTPSLHYCLNHLPKLVNNNPFLDLKAFNKQNLTVGDILISFDSLLQQERVLEGHKFPRGKRINTYERDVDVRKATINVGEWNVETIRRAEECRLVVAALIATVSFTAGFTVPGGLDQNPGESIGMAVFKSKISFKVFLVSDAMAFLCSTLAILCYFVLVSTEAQWGIKFLSIWALMLSTISLGALMVAFLAGVSAISSNPLGLVIASSVIFFICYCCLIIRIIQTVRHVWGNITVRDLLGILFKTTSYVSQ